MLQADPAGSNLFGGGGDDQLIGDIGNDFMTGGADDDLFVLVPNGGADTITDFIAGAGTDDTIDLTAFDPVAAQAAVDAAAQQGSDTVIDFGGGQTITLAGVVVADLHADDFLI